MRVKRSKTLALGSSGGGAGGARSTAGVVSDIGTSVAAAVVSSCPLMVLVARQGSGSWFANPGQPKRAKIRGRNRDQFRDPGTRGPNSRSQEAP